MSTNEITRTVEIEHKGEKLYVQVHVHLSQEEIERIVTPAVLKSLSRQMRMAGNVHNPMYVIAVPGSEHAV